MPIDNDQFSKLNDSLCGITIHCWGTDSQSSNGMVAFFDSTLFGGNVGHAAINIKLPINPTTKTWIETYCLAKTYEQFKAERGRNVSYDEYFHSVEKIIPVTVKHQGTRKAKLNKDGQVVPTTEAAFEQKYYEIDWSWWPERLQTTDQDAVSGRIGRSYDYNPEWKEMINPEQRIHRGPLGKRLMDYAPFTIVHQRDLPDIELEKLKYDVRLANISEQLELVDSVADKVDQMFETKINDSLRLMFFNLGIDINSLDEIEELDHLKESLLTELNTKRTSLQVERFRLRRQSFDFNTMLNEARTVLEGLNSQLAAQKSKSTEIDVNLQLEIRKAEENLSRIQKFHQFYAANPTAYMVVGLPPDHSVSLPIATEETRGFQVEAMLQKMRELLEPMGKPFNLETNNCSHTTTEVLAAGCEDDILLHSIVSTRVLGYLGTPQQVLENAQLASQAITDGKTANFFTSVSFFTPLDTLMGYSLKLLLESDSTGGKIAGLLLVGLVGILKIPGFILGSLLNPKAAYDDLVNTISRIYDRDSLALKIVFTIFAVPAFLVIGPLAALQTMLEVAASIITAPFKYFINRSKEKSENTPDEITAQVGSNTNSDRTSEQNNALAVLLNQKIKANLDSNTITLENIGSPADIIAEFALQLSQNPEKVVVLNAAAQDSITQFLMTSDEEQVKQQYYDCCNQSIARSQKFAPKTREAVDRHIKEVKHFKPVLSGPASESLTSAEPTKKPPLP